jgi:hypothetical protein
LLAEAFLSGEDGPDVRTETRLRGTTANSSRSFARAMVIVLALGHNEALEKVPAALKES